jgi:hypothetical protein
MLKSYMMFAPPVGINPDMNRAAVYYTYWLYTSHSRPLYQL